MTILQTIGTIGADGKLTVEQSFAGAPRQVKVSVDEESDEEFATRFAALVTTWKQATRFSSKMGKDAEHPAFREIVAMGERAVPLILADTEKNGGHLFMALHQITGAEPPIPEGHRGNKEVAPGWIGYDIKGMQAAWLAWGREKGYRWEHAV